MDLQYTFGHLLNRSFEVKEGDERFTPRFRFTETALDRHSEVVVASGLDLRNWKANPQIFFGHMAWTPPIGNGIPESIEQTDKFIDGNILFDDTGEDAFASLISHKVLKGFLKTVSIGFSSKERSDEPMFPKQTGVTHLKGELFETSIVPIPALVKAKRRKNQDAVLAEYKRFTGQLQEMGVDADAQVEYYVKELNALDDDQAEFLGYGKKTQVTVPEVTDAQVEKYLADNNLKAVTQDFIQEVGEVKEGRVLSGKNRTLVSSARDALDQLLEATEPKGDPEPKKSDNSTIIVDLRSTAEYLQSIASQIK